MSLSSMLQVLVVDDHLTSRMITVEALQALDIKNIHIAKDGREGFAKAVSGKIHLIITDLHMPDIDGLQLLRAVRSHAAIGRTGVIIITGSNDANLLNEAKKLGANNVMGKQFSVPQLKGAIEAVVGRLH